jgi:hypothetical protein
LVDLLRQEVDSVLVHLLLLRQEGFPLVMHLPTAQTKRLRVALAMEPLLLLTAAAVAVEALVLVVRTHRHQQQHLRVEPHLPRFLVALASEVLHRELQSRLKRVVDSVSQVVLQQRRHQCLLVEALPSVGLRLPLQHHKKRANLALLQIAFRSAEHRRRQLQLPSQPKRLGVPHLLLPLVTAFHLRVILPVALVLEGPHLLPIRSQRPEHRYRPLPGFPHP